MAGPGRKILQMDDIPENQRGTLKTALAEGTSGLKLDVEAMSWDEVWTALQEVSDDCMRGTISVTCC